MPKIFLQKKDSKTIEEIHPKELEDFFKIKWSDTIYDAASKKPLSESFQDRGPELVIKYMGESVGYGLFAKKPIKKGQFICIYAGEHFKDPKLAAGEYTHTAEPARTNLIMQGIFPPSINAKGCGNAARFSQHLPSKKELEEQYKTTDPNFLKNVATENIKREFLRDERTGTIFPIFVAARDIEAGELLGYDYDGSYWHQTSVTPRNFLKDGTIIDPKLLNPVFLDIAIQPFPGCEQRFRTTRSTAQLQELCDRQHYIIFDENPLLMVSSKNIQAALETRNPYPAFLAAMPSVDNRSWFTLLNEKNPPFPLVKHHLNPPQYPSDPADFEKFRRT